MTAVRFKTKVDWWVGASIVLALILGPLAVVATKEWVWLPLVLASDLVVVLLCFPCDYTLEENEVVIRSGVMRWRIPYADIARVFPTRSPLSSPAWSLDRLALVYGKKCVLISPEEARAFVGKLAARAGMNQRGLALYRESSPHH